MSDKILDELEKDSIVLDEGIYAPGFHFLTGILISILLLIFEAYYFIIIPFFVTLILQTTREVIELDFNSRRYRDGYKFLGKIYGNWLPIPNIQYVSIIGRNLKTLGSGNLGPIPDTLVNTTSHIFSTYEIRLFSSISRRINLYQVENYSAALKIGTKIAEKLNEKLLDATVKPQKFIIP